MGKYLKAFQKSEDFIANKESLSEPWVVFIHDVKETEEEKEQVRYKNIVLTVSQCIELGYFSAPSKVDDCYVISTLKEFPYPVQVIRDFKNVFFEKQGLSGETASTPYSFCLGNKAHLPERQQKYIVNLLSQTPYNRALSTFKLKNFYLPNTDMYLKQTEYSNYWQYSHDFLSGSTFRNVTLDIRGNISSAYHLFRGLTCESLEFVVNGKSDGSDLIRPENNMAEMYQNAKIKNMPRNINYSLRSSNWLFTGLNLIGEEIPNVGNIETEEERITNSKNRILVGPGMCYQLSLGLGAKKFGPVLDCIQCNGYEYIWGNCAISLPKATDVRFKNLNNIDYDFRGGNNNHKNVNVPKMDLDSIKYAVENVVDQRQWLFTNHTCQNVADNAFSVTASDYHLIYHAPTSRANNNDGASATMFSGSKFKATIPEEYNLIITGYRKSGNTYYATGEVLTIIGNNSEQSIEFTNANSTYATFMISYTSGDSIAPDRLNFNDIFIIKRVTSTDSDGNDVYTAYDIPSFTHKCIFPDGVYTFEEVGNYLGYSVNMAQQKGWDIYVGNSKLYGVPV